MDYWEIVECLNTDDLTYLYIGDIQDAVVETDDEGWNLLHWSACVGNEHMVKVLLSNSMEIDKPNKNGNTPAIIAAHNFHEKCVLLLLESGANPFRHANGYNLLHAASTCGLLSLTQKLIALDPAKILLSQRTESRHSRMPLHWAVQEGHFDICKALLIAGADPNAYDSLEEDAYSYHTPLSSAVGGGHTEIVELLMEFNAQLSFENEKVESPLLLAASWERHAIIQLFVDSNSCSFRQSECDEAILAAHKLRDQEMVRILKIIKERCRDSTTG